MHLVIRIDGNEYISEETEGLSAKEASDAVHCLLNSDEQTPPRNMKTVLTDGGILMLGKDAMSRAQIIYYD